MTNQALHNFAPGSLTYLLKLPFLSLKHITLIVTSGPLQLPFLHLEPSSPRGRYPAAARPLLRSFPAKPGSNNSSPSSPNIASNLPALICFFMVCYHLT